MDLPAPARRQLGTFGDPADLLIAGDKSMDWQDAAAMPRRLFICASLKWNNFGHDGLQYCWLVQSQQPSNQKAMGGFCMPSFAKNISRLGLVSVASLFASLAVQPAQAQSANTTFFV